MLNRLDKDISLTGGPPVAINAFQKAGTVLGLVGMLILVLAAFNVDFPNKGLWFSICFSAIAGGII
mgnify:CR=1 FL=1